MAAEPTLEPTLLHDEEEEENDEGDESDVYEIEGEEDEGDQYEPEEDEDDEGDEEDAAEGRRENMTALLLGKQNGAAREEGDEEDEDEDEEYQEYQEDELTGQNAADGAVVAGSKRGVDELSEGDAEGEEVDDESDGETAPKKARV